jgi:hypothetical protein
LQCAFDVKVEGQRILDVAVQLDRRRLPAPRAMIVVGHARGEPGRTKCGFSARQIGFVHEQIEIAADPQRSASVEPFSKDWALEQNGADIRFAKRAQHTLQLRTPVERGEGRIAFDLVETIGECRRCRVLSRAKTRGHPGLHMLFFGQRERCLPLRLVDRAGDVLSAQELEQTRHARSHMDDSPTAIAANRACAAPHASPRSERTAVAFSIILASVAMTRAGVRCTGIVC